MNPFNRKIGAFYKSNGDCEFIVWAPLKNKVELVITHPEKKSHQLLQDDWGFWKITIQGVLPGAHYMYRLDGELERPDPASASQPEGVHSASQLIDRSFTWTDNEWNGKALGELIIYELHTGTFTKEGTFDGVISKLDYLKDLGINAIEIMPVNQFPGRRNWGYDGVYSFAVQNSYGTIQDFKKLVDAAHHAGIAIILDVVYNHLGPDGNYLGDFAPYFTDKYKTPWSEALNFDGPWCDGVRNYFIQNALMWLDEFHIDALRMDAVNAIWDFSASHFMLELKKAVNELEITTGRQKILIAELDLNNPRYINPLQKGGYGIDGQWIDEFHHALHSVITGETDGYYEDFGSLRHLEKAMRNTYVYNGTYSKHRKKIFGDQPSNDYNQFVVFSQNHDHIGNRALGDRLTATLSFEELKLTASTVLLSPYVPLLFMGEEYGEKNPFLYFIDHNEQLAEMVREGRKNEFSYFNFMNDFPDPQAKETFDKSILSWDNISEGSSTLLAFYKYLIRFRNTHSAMQSKERESMTVYPVIGEKILSFERISSDNKLLIVLNFDDASNMFLNNTASKYHKIFDSSASVWNGPGETWSGDLNANESFAINPKSAVVFERIS